MDLEENKNTALYGIIGNPLGHTLSPAVHNTAFKACGINAVYLPFETLDPLSCLKAAKALPIKGLSVTIPYKSRILPHLDFVELTAAAIGAVNTVVNRGGKLHGFNTDASAAMEALGNVIKPRETTCLLLGAGGAARALGYALTGVCRDITIANRTVRHAEALACSLGCRWVDLSRVCNVKADLVINATCVGMYPETDSIPIPERVLEHATAVMDIIYRPKRTALLDLAARSGCITIGGEQMFLRQAAAQFRLWTGFEAPFEIMRDAFEGAMKGIK
jgi:shikimate dehydrogenase